MTDEEKNKQQFEKFIEDYFSRYQIHKIYNKASIYTDPQDGTCNYIAATGNHYVIVTGYNEMCLYIKVRIITHSTNYDNIAIDPLKLRDKTAKELFGKGYSRYSKTDFYVEARALSRGGYGFYDMTNSIPDY